MQEALRRVLRPLADWVIARGVPYAAVDEVLRAMLVEAAYAAYPDLAPHRRASRVTAATGLHRREVTRLLKTEALPPPKPSRAHEIFSRWISLATYDTGTGSGRTLPRTGPAPSFESLARSVTRDVHPRTLLEELVRLNRITVDAEADTVSLSRDSYVPRGDDAQLLSLLGQNVGDHLAAAAANVQSVAGEHFEQAIFADGLLPESVLALRPRVTEQWRAMVASLVPELQAMVEHDANRMPHAERRVRIGLYTYHAPAPSGPAPDEPEDAAEAPARARRAPRAAKPSGMPGGSAGGTGDASAAPAPPAVPVPRRSTSRKR